MTPEGKVKIWFMNQVDKRYGHLAVWSYAPPGGYFGQNGTMDRLLTIESGSPDFRHLYEKYGPPQGVIAGIELKAENGVLSPLQRRKLEELHRAGGVAAVLVGKDHGKVARIFDEIDRRREMCRSAWLRMIEADQISKGPDAFLNAVMETNSIFAELPFVPATEPLAYKKDENAV